MSTRYNTANTINNLGSTYDSQGKYDDAIAQYERALRIYENAYGLQDMRNASILNELASLYFKQGNQKQAVAFYTRTSQLLSPFSTNVEMLEHFARCDGCGTDPLKGYRYKCIDCKDYDLCIKCISKRIWIHYPLHNFLQIPALGLSQSSAALDENFVEIEEWID